MEIDVGNALAEVATPGISPVALDRLDDRVGRAHDRIQAGRSAETHGYAALSLPERTDPGAIASAIDALPDATHVLLVGIGGSALGAATMADALGSGRSLHVLDNVDPDAIDATLAEVPLDDTVVHVVSRSGRTTETLTNAAIVAAEMEAAGVEWRSRTLVTTGPDGPLRELADRHDLPVLDVPSGVPGRYAALSTVGLPAIGLLGHDVEALLAGGARAVDGLAPSLFECAPYAFGAVSYALAVRGATVNAMMPYGERLETFAEWFAQLWAESLGKDGLGQVPARSLGVTDQHSQLQLYRAGPRAVQVSFLAVRERGDRRVPETAVPGSEFVAGRSLADLMEASFRGTEASLAAAGRPSVRLEIDRLDEGSLGELLVGMEAACMLAAELFGVDAFDQPAVEWGKRATSGLLRGEDTPETETVAEKRTLRVPPR